MEVKEKRELEVKVDKRHVISIGERLYAESVELLRELVNNAYDADATEVYVEINPERVLVQDNGSGMDLEGLRQYFIIGSEEKVLHSISPRFGRERIGQFGIGKFASLGAASRFEVVTQNGDFAARVIFDKRAWEESKDKWHLPCEILVADGARGDGTTVILSHLSKSLDLEEAEEIIRDGVPLKAPNFAVYLNKRRISPKSLTGQKIPVLEGCPYGLVSGEIVIVPSTMASTKDLGIDIKVKGVTIKKDLFGMETWGKAVARIKGEISANFLALTSDRSNFLTDSEEYQAFLKVMEKIIGVIKRELGKEADQRQDRMAGRVVREALQRIHRALAKNPEFSPFGPIPYGEEMGIGGGAVVGAGKKKAEREVKPEGEKTEALQKPKVTRRRHPLVKKITPNAIVRRIRMGEQSISVCLDFLENRAPNVFPKEMSSISIATTFFLKGNPADQPPTRCISPVS